MFCTVLALCMYVCINICLCVCVCVCKYTVLCICYFVLCAVSRCPVDLTLMSQCLHTHLLICLSINQYLITSLSPTYLSMHVCVCVYRVTSNTLRSSPNAGLRCSICSLCPLTPPQSSSCWRWKHSENYKKRVAVGAPGRAVFSSKRVRVRALR